MIPKNNPNSKLEVLIEEARRKVEAMTPAERAAMYEAQRRSYVRGEAGFGSDADEAAYAAALAAGDADALDRLDREAQQRMKAADAWLERHP